MTKNVEAPTALAFTNQRLVEAPTALAFINGRELTQRVIFKVFEGN